MSEYIKSVVLEGEVITDYDITCGGEFLPEIHGKQASMLMMQINNVWVEKAKPLGAIISKANENLPKQEFESWLARHCRIKYPMAMQLIRVSKMKDVTIKAILDNGFTSSHVIKLLSLKDETQQVDFLEEETHVIDEYGTEIQTKKMTAKDVQDAIKIINKKPDPERTGTERFLRIVRQIDNSLEKMSTDFQEDVIDNKEVDINEMSDDDINSIASCSRMLDFFKDEYKLVIQKLMPNE